MTPDAYATILVGIAATFVAAIVNLVAGFFRSRAEHRRELAKMAMELALVDLEDARNRNKEDRSHIVRPTSSYVWFYYWFLRRIDRKSFNQKVIVTHLNEYGMLLKEYEKHEEHQMNSHDSANEA